MMTARLLKRSVPAAIIGTTLGLLSISSGDTGDQEALGHKKDHDEITFKMVGAQATCLQRAFARVTIRAAGPVEKMHVEVFGLPPNTDFDFFVIQVPKGPFGLSWYQGDIETNKHGRGSQDFIGRFSIETFIVAPDVAPAPVIHTSPIADANMNPKTAPVHTFHLGLWFNSPADAVKAGCPGAVTPFNGEHNAGVQILNTSNFPDEAGPLSMLQSQQ